MKKGKAISLILMLIILVSCTKDLITPLDADKIAVVESYLYAGDSIIKVKVTKVLPFSEDTLDATEYITGLHLQVNGADLTESEPGIYTLDLGNKSINPDSTYYVKFRFYDDTISSSTVIPAKPTGFSLSATTVYTDRITSTSGFPGSPMKDIDLTWDNDDYSYYYLTVEYLETTLDYINYAMEAYDLPLAESISPLQSAGTRLGMRNFEFFGRYRVVLFKVNKDFADLYQHLTSNSNNITTPVTTIKNGYGVFTGMSSDTVYIQVLEN
ncbi:MAG: DUF4249 family protein [Bacteroidetes bacterium]|nr:DUF4249 family protein [Bacteroidota bacterium]